MAKIVVCKLEECPNHLKPMKLIEEFDTSWAFVCLVCQNTRIVTKDKVGGTWGAGRKADGTHSVFGKGF